MKSTKYKSKSLRLTSMIVDLICYIVTFPFAIIGKILDIADTATR